LIEFVLMQVKAILENYNIFIYLVVILLIYLENISNLDLRVTFSCVYYPCKVKIQNILTLILLL